MPASAGTWVIAHTGSGTSLTSGSIGTTVVGDVIWAVTFDGNNGTDPTGSDSKANGGWGQLGTSQLDGGSGVRMTVSYAENIANAGSGHTCTATYGSANNIALHAGYVTGTIGAGAVDTGSLAQLTDGSSPYSITSNTPAQSDNYWLLFYCPPDAGLGTEVFTAPSGYAILAQTTDRNTSYCGATFGLAVVSGSAQTVTPSDTSTSGNRLLKFVAVRSSGGAAAPVQAPELLSLKGKGPFAFHPWVKPLLNTQANLPEYTPASTVPPMLALKGKGPFNVRPWVKPLIVNQAPAVSGDVTIQLTGVTGTGSVGVLGVDVAPVVAGVSGTGSTGTVGAGVAPSLAAVSGTGSVGSLGVGVSISLTGVTGTGSVGTISPGISFGLAGVSGTGSVGVLVPSITVTLGGVTGVGSVGTITSSGGTPVGSSGRAVSQYASVSGYQGVSAWPSVSGYQSVSYM